MAVKCQIRGLSKSFGTSRVVNDVSLDIADGEFVVFLGPSGCGKTTTLRLVAGLEVADAGTIAIDGRLVSAPAQGIFVRPEHRGIGMVFQSYAIWPHMSVFENVAYPLRVRRLRKNEMQRKVGEVLDLVGLGGEASRAATALSGGQMQRVALARALVFDPTLLLFDEPLSNLDLKLRERLRVELKTLQRRTGITSIYVTHDQIEAVELADRIVVMQGGRIEQIGPAAELYRQPRTRFVAEFIATANIFEAVVVDLAGPGLARVRTNYGRELAATFDKPVSAGDLVDLVVHPEDCALVDASEAGDEAGYPVRVLARHFQGTSTRYTVDWQGNPFDVIMLGTSSHMPEGARVRLSIAAERACIVAREGVAAT
jgi:iron(III) transport system ATP-binding protein